MMKLSSFFLANLATLAVVPWLGAADAEPGAQDLSTGWKLKLGDHASWSDPALDDGDWRSIQVGRPWEEQGFADHDGYAWYRLRFRLPAELREHRDFKRQGRLKFTLGLVDDVDQTWLNGELIGATGGFPEAYRPAWSAPRSYQAPGRLLQWDFENVLAVRVFDGANQGGMVEGPYRVEPVSLGDLIRLTFDFGDTDGILRRGEGMPVRVILQNASSLEVAGKVSWRVETDEGVELRRNATSRTLPAGGQLSFGRPFRPPVPGFSRITYTFHDSAEEGIQLSAARVVGYRPEEIQSPLTKEDDFDAFWRQTLDQLADVAPEFTLTRQAEFDSSTHEVYEVMMRSLGGVRVGGWYEKPKLNSGSPFPALLRVPGYGSSMRPSGGGDPIAIFSFNVRGHGNSQADVSGTPGDFWIRGLDDQQGYYYQGAYADCVRAVDFLASRPEVDAERIAVTGGSQGGGLSLATAALDPRIRLCAPDIPFLCDWVRYFKTSDWPEMDEWVRAKPHRSWDTTLRTLSYFDTLNLADRIKCPVLVGLGLQDEVCPPSTIFSVYNRLRGPKEYRVYPEAGHWVGASHDRDRRQWILDHFLRANGGGTEAHSGRR